MSASIEQIWLGHAGAAPGFGISIDGQYVIGTGADWLPYEESIKTSPSGRTTHMVSRRHRLGLKVSACTRTFSDCSAVERWVEIENIGDAVRLISRIDSLYCRLPKARYTLHYYTGTWGQEFKPRDERLTLPVVIETRTGRSSSGCHPWFALETGGTWLCGSVAWPGNHIVRIEPEGEGWTVSGGIHDWELCIELAPGEKFVAPSVILAAGPSRDEAAREYHRWGRAHGYPKTTLAGALPVEWNHWWPYEDTDINEDVFRANTDRAAAMGFDAVTLDAGWFGPSGDTAWPDVRGDWDLVNTERFPNGIRPLAHHAHELGLKFGIWCEIEAVGPKAVLNDAHPEFIAKRDGNHLGCVCLGNAGAREWAYDTLKRLITDNAADWIKVDYNVEPGAGCNRTDHGHSAGDGQYRHYQGLLEVISRVRAEFPNVLLEACASGGLRIDLATLQHFPIVFLSDPDYPAHNLQLFWGAMDYVAPNACLHWSWSENKGAFASFDPYDPALSDTKLDYIVRTGMLGFFGMSQKLPDLPERVAARFARHLAIYRERVAPLVRNADVYRLTGQPLRDGGGDRWCAFHYTLPEDGSGALFVFRLTGGDSSRTIRLKGLAPDRTYTLEWDGEARTEKATGANLMEKGLTFSLGEEESALIFIHL